MRPIGQRPLLLLGALAIIVGVQLLSLGLIGELIANSRARGGPDQAQVARVVEGGTAVVSVEAGLPVAVGLAAVSLNSLMKARTTLWVDEPLVENAMLWPSASLMVLIAGFLAYQ